MQPHSGKCMRQHQPGEDGSKPHMHESIVVSTFDATTNRRQETVIETAKFDAVLFEAQRLKTLQQRFRGTPLGEAHERARQPKLESAFESQLALCAAVTAVDTGAVGSGKDCDHLSTGCIADNDILPILLWTWCP